MHFSNNLLKEVFFLAWDSASSVMFLCSQFSASLKGLISVLSFWWKKPQHWAWHTISLSVLTCGMVDRGRSVHSGVWAIENLQVLLAVKGLKGYIGEMIGELWTCKYKHSNTLQLLGCAYIWMAKTFLCSTFSAFMSTGIRTVYLWKSGHCHSSVP